MRDWFAGQALAGLCANVVAWQTSTKDDEFAKAAYAAADEMMKARER